MRWRVGGLLEAGACGLYPVLAREEVGVRQRLGFDDGRRPGRRIRLTISADHPARQAFRTESLRIGVRSSNTDTHSLGDAGQAHAVGALDGFGPHGGALRLGHTREFTGLRFSRGSVDLRV